ncbi:MAG TPA: fibronectin type III domain-containing protein, partial [Candidatus Lokiarchaeia archaeon]|nr:fibronectin type III domain-containing protein [Candidatus Lokiarchaeia archaeon]
VSSSFTYSIFYDTSPRGVILENPMDGTFLNTFNVLLQWAASSWDTGHINYYEIQVDTNSSFNNFSGFMSDNITSGETSTSFPYTAKTSAWFYWRVRAVDYTGNLGAWSGTYSFAVDITPPNAPVLAPLPLYFVNGRFQLNWTVPSDGPFTVQSYNIYMSTLPGVTASSANMITTSGAQLQNFYFTPNLSPGYYYFRVSAVDHAGWESALSNEVGTVVVLGKYFDSRNQNFSVQAGDILEYEIENVISPTMTATGQPNFTYGYGTWATSFIAGNRFDFWIQNVDRQLVTPVTANFYGRLAVSLGYDLLTTDYPLIPFVASSDPAYMRAVAEAFVTSALFGADLNGVLNYTGTAQYGFNVVNTYTLTYSSVYVDAKNDHYAMRASFVYDATTGVLLELTSYNALSGVGYSLRLVDTTVPLSVSWQTWNPVIFIVALLVFAGIISVIIKKVQYR